MEKYHLFNYVSKGVIGFAGFALYDVYVEGREFNGFASYDALAYTLGVISAEWAADMLSNFMDVNGNSVSGFITRPLLTGIVYMYLFDYMVRPSFSSNRDNVNLVLMGAVSCLVLNYASNPIMSLFGVNTY